MNIIRNQLFWWGLITVVGIMPYQANAVNGIAITSPSGGQSIVPGQVVQVIVQPVGSFTISSVLIVTPVGVQLVNQPPFTANLAIPQTAVGSLIIRALGKDPSGIIAASEITITVQPTAALQTLQVIPSSFHFAVLGALKQLSVNGVYTDNITRDLTKAENGTTYRSSNNAVVTVCPNGIMRTQGNGAATVTTTNTGINATVKVTVDGQGSLAGDLNRDGVVDCRDISIIVAALGKQSGRAGFNPLADTNSDGVINGDDLILILHELSPSVHCPLKCPLGQGFWKNKPNAWPVGIPSVILGSQTYTQAQLLTILRTPVGAGSNADVSLILADQLIAVKLSIANGSDPAPISATVTAADMLLKGFTGTLPYKVSPSSATGQAMVNNANTLNNYNNDQLTPNCIP